MTKIAAFQEKQNLRKIMRQRRRALTAEQQQTAAEALLQQVKSLPLFIHSKAIAFYLTNDGEIDPLLLLEYAFSQGKHCYLPIIHPGEKHYLLFANFKPGQALFNNRYGILEPSINSFSQCIPPQALDLVFTPLVAFDTQGHRLGMGGGYYDRSFAFLRNNRISRQQQQAFGLSQARQQKLSNFQQLRQKTQLIGLAHQCQQVPHVPHDAWDLPLAQLITDQTSIHQPR